MSEEIFKQYSQLMVCIDSIMLNLYRKWIDNIGEDVTQRLKRPLMNRSPTKPGLLECNIDRSLLDLFREAKYWEALKFEIPGHVNTVYKKTNVIKIIYESVLSVVMDYNKILAALSDEERLLFKQLINNVEKKVAPGLSKLNWATDVSDAYIAECCAVTADVRILICRCISSF